MSCLRREQGSADLLPGRTGLVVGERLRLLLLPGQLGKPVRGGAGAGGGVLAAGGGAGGAAVASATATAAAAD